MNVPILTSVVLLVLNVVAQAADVKPNIVLVMTDDQGYGDDVQITFTAELSAGSHQLAPAFVTATGDEVGAYYAVVKAVQ